MITLRRLIAISSIPVFTSVVLYFILQDKKYRDVSEKKKQIVIGIIFGIIAIIATEFGVPVDDTIINVRDAAPLCAGLFFGPLAGIISGLIGGIERWFCVYWGGGEYTRLACSIATVLTGFIAAYLRKNIFEDKIPQWSLALFAGVFCETIHMVLIFLTNISDAKEAFTYVRTCSLMMISVNSIAVALVALIISMIERDTQKKQVIPTISSQYQNGLIVVVVAGLLISSALTYVIQTRITIGDTVDMMALNIIDTYFDVIDQINASMSDTARQIGEDYFVDLKGTDLDWIADYYGVKEIIITDNEGIVLTSNVPEYIGFDVLPGEESAYISSNFLNATSHIARKSILDFEDENGNFHYAAYMYDDYIIIISLDNDQYDTAVKNKLKSITRNRRIGEWGELMVVDKEGYIISDYYDGQPQNVKDLGLEFGNGDFETRHRYTIRMDDMDYYYIYDDMGMFLVYAFMPVEEADFSRVFSVYLNIFMQIIVFGLLFVSTYYVTRRRIVNSIDKVNDSLEKITDGQLQTVVDVKNNQEFISLSDGINTTVDSLKRFIQEANDRIDTELRYAKEIQFSVLPTDFPAFPDHDEFDLYALMDPAREVGGDFYDFYMISEHVLVFLVADVSGKGIPASLFMMRAKTMIKNYAEAGIAPADIFTNANYWLCEGNDARMFVTAWIGFLNLENGELRFANAGHNPPVIRRKNGDFEYLKTPANFVLAGMDSICYKEQSLVLEPGDEIFLYTDGVVEATDPKKELYGEQRLIECLNLHKNDNAKDICDRVKEDVDLFYTGAEQFDDITELAVIFKSYAKQKKS